jgi:hypothetical protein
VWLGVAVAALLGGACGLGDLLSYNFQLPEKSFTIDTATVVPQQWQQLPATATLPAVPCPQVSCCTIASGPGEQCATLGLACEAGSCAASPQVTLSNPVNLAQQAPELQSVASSVPSFASVTVSRLYLSSYTSTLNYDTPPIDLYIGPESAATVEDKDPSGNPLCVQIGTLDPLPPCPAGCGAVDVHLSADGQAAVGRFAKDFRQTFKVFARAQLSFKAGDPVPKGKLDLTVTGTLKASL